MFVTSKVSRSRNCQYLFYLYFHLLTMLYSNAENRVAALEQMFSVYQDQPAELMERMKATAEAFEQLSDANAQLEKYKRTYGDLSTLPPDIAHLAEQLRTKEEELERLRMSVTQQTEVFQAYLYAISISSPPVAPCSLKSLCFLS